MSLKLPEGAEDFFAALEDYTPTIPDVLTEHFLAKSGCADADIHVIRLVSLAAQKFIADVAEEAHWHCLQRQQAANKQKLEHGYDARDKRKLLTTEDLACAMKEYGVNIQKPVYFADSVPRKTVNNAGGTQ
mmetsp:Transcript_40201/g.55805  ORF Transcript_40201/g.55805 Transcript_40201/m.55805 type:complete len:131 (+) Transcript_40201:139-531(+)|eukprot:CAMPEP_0196580816 /NCGR_PEP_ID=MMETSP1081-20130531/30764_1 /TAXON_ID=36882 /ORGANISM="Pyramimonas amylifera, Strain CCMP720" /LENGTH=130 /DNA_ID=CAMNT_0041900811 /DNA_START=137 /DNA_END=529 /DNA_ORIENTATION=-